MPLVVHGIVATEAVPRLDESALAEAAGADVVFVGGDELTGLTTSTDQAELMPTRSNLLAHTRLLETVVQETAVVPMRFGVVVPDEETLVRTTLDGRQQELLERLQRLSGRVEMRVVGRYEEEPAVARVLATDRRAARLRERRGIDAKMELGERIVTGIAELRQQDEAQALQELRPYADDVAVSEVGQPLDAFALSFLIAQEDRPRFEEAVDRLGARLAPVVAIELIGPLPPFSFAGSGGT